MIIQQSIININKYVSISALPGENYQIKGNNFFAYVLKLY
jgi:hypothetical protein